MSQSATLVKKIAISVAGLSLAWLAVVVGLGNIARSSPPEAFASYGLNDARLMGRRSELVLVSAQDARAISRAERLAKAALKRDPTVISAIRTLAAAHELRADNLAALRLMRYSEAMSRRDFPTHFWLIDYEAKQNNVAKALDHYDAALRTSSAAEPILMPILLDAFGSTDLTDPLANVLARKPAWAATFVSKAISETAHTEKMLKLAFLLRTKNFEIDPEPLAVLINRAVRDGLYSGALRLSRRPAQPEGIFNSEFDNEPKFAPFDWALTSGSDLGSERMPEEDKAAEHRLYLYGASGRGGIVATQLLLLKPGKYRLEALVSDVPETIQDRPYISVTCDGKKASVMTTADFPAASKAPGKVSAIFEVPPQDCRAQWFNISVRASNRIGGTQSSIHNAAITPSVSS